jgi:hypothetical protein
MDIQFTVARINDTLRGKNKMSLTHQAYQERMWGPFPAIRKVLEKREVPGEYYGLTSIDDNEFEFMRRMTEIAILVNEHKTHLIAFTNADNVKEVYEDLDRLVELLKRASSYFNNKADSIYAISRDLTNNR